MRPTDQRRRPSIYGGLFVGPVQMGGSQTNVYNFPARRIYVAVILVAVLGLLAWLTYHLYTSSDGYRMRAEEKLLRELKPGQGYYKINEKLQSEPDYSIKLKSGKTLHQYERQYETLQILVNKAGTTLSIGIYAKTSEFRPSVQIGGIDVRLNATTIGRAVAPFSPAAANAYCGAHKAGYFEAYYPMPNALEARNLVVGLSNANSNIDVSDACKVEAESKCEAPDDPVENKVFKGFAKCVVKSRSAQALRNELKTTVLIVTAPAQEITRDMLYPPDLPGLSPTG